MRLTLTFLIRTTMVFGLALFVAAVTLSRAVPRPSAFRSKVAPRYYGVNGKSFTPYVEGNFLLDTEAGRLIPLKTPDGVAVDHAISSPWRDESGGAEVVGRYTTRIGSPPSTSFEGTGLARFRKTGGAGLGGVSLDLVIAGRPCRLPGSVSRLLFPVGDGRLYSQEFFTEGRNPGVDPDDAPRPILWRCPVPGQGQVRLGDAVASTVPGFGGRLVVALSNLPAGGVKGRLSPSEIWWLALDPDGREVVAAGRLTPETGDASGEEQERLPNLTATPDGRPALAYLARTEGRAEWRLKVAPVGITPGGGTPFVAASAVCELADDCAACAPAFSADGRWLYRVARSPGADGPVRQFSVPDALGPDAPVLADLRGRTAR